MFFISLTIVIGCEKDLNDKSIQESVFELKIDLNNSPYKSFIFSENGVKEEIIFLEGNLDKKVIYSFNEEKSALIKTYYDELNEKIRFDSLFFDQSQRVSLIVYYFYSDKNQDFDNLDHYQLLEYNGLGKLATHIDYDSTYNHYLTLSYEYYPNGNVSRKLYPIDTGLPQDSMEYDNKKSIYSLLNLPEIDELGISNNNITKITRKQQSSDGFSTYESEFVYYSSIFEYDSNGYPIKEIRKYSENKIDTFTFEINEIDYIIPSH